MTHGLSTWDADGNQILNTQSDGGLDGNMRVTGAYEIPMSKTQLGLTTSIFTSSRQNTATVSNVPYLGNVSVENQNLLVVATQADGTNNRMSAYIDFFRGGGNDASWDTGRLGAGLNNIGSRLEQAGLDLSSGPVVRAERSTPASSTTATDGTITLLGSGRDLGLNYLALGVETPNTADANVSLDGANNPGGFGLQLWDDIVIREAQPSNRNGVALVGTVPAPGNLTPGTITDTSGNNVMTYVDTGADVFYDIAVPEAVVSTDQPVGTALTVTAAYGDFMDNDNNTTPLILSESSATIQSNGVVRVSLGQRAGDAAIENWQGFFMTVRTTVAGNYITSIDRMNIRLRDPDGNESEDYVRSLAEDINALNIPANSGFGIFPQRTQNGVVNNISNHGILTGANWAGGTLDPTINMSSTQGYTGNFDMQLRTFVSGTTTFWFLEFNTNRVTYDRDETARAGRTDTTTTTRTINGTVDDDNNIRVVLSPSEGIRANNMARTNGGDVTVNIVRIPTGGTTLPVGSFIYGNLGRQYGVLTSALAVTRTGSLTIPNASVNWILERATFAPNTRFPQNNHAFLGSEREFFQHGAGGELPPFPVQAIALSGFFQAAENEVRGQSDPIWTVDHNHRGLPVIARGLAEQVYRPGAAQSFHLSTFGDARHTSSSGRDMGRVWLCELPVSAENPLVFIRPAYARFAEGTDVEIFNNRNNFNIPTQWTLHAQFCGIGTASNGRKYALLVSHNDTPIEYTVVDIPNSVTGTGYDGSTAASRRETGFGMAVFDGTNTTTTANGTALGRQVYNTNIEAIVPRRAQDFNIFDNPAVDLRRDSDGNPIDNVSVNGRTTTSVTAATTAGRLRFNSGFRRTNIGSFGFRLPDDFQIGSVIFNRDPQGDEWDTTAWPARAARVVEIIERGNTSINTAGGLPWVVEAIPIDPVQIQSATVVDLPVTGSSFGDQTLGWHNEEQFFPVETIVFPYIPNGATTVADRNRTIIADNGVFYRWPVLGDASQGRNVSFTSQIIQVAATGEAFNVSTPTNNRMTFSDGVERTIDRNYVRATRQATFSDFAFMNNVTGYIWTDTEAQGRATLPYGMLWTSRDATFTISFTGVPDIVTEAQVFAFGAGNMGQFFSFAGGPGDPITGFTSSQRFFSGNSPPLPTGQRFGGSFGSRISGSDAVGSSFPDDRGPWSFFIRNPFDRRIS